MSSKTNNVRIGIFVLVAIGLLIAGLLAFGARSYFTKKTVFETAIPSDVSGLSVGSKVLFRGVPIGKVSNIDFGVNLYPSSKRGMIVVEFEVERRIFVGVRTAEQKQRAAVEEVAGGLRAMVKGQGITGTSILTLERLDPQLFPPPPIDYTPRYLYIPSAPGQFSRMLESIEQSLGHIRDLDLKGIGVEVSNTLARASLLLEKLQQLKLEATVDKAGNMLDQITATVTNLDNTITAMKLPTLTGDADGLVVGLKGSNTKLQTFLDHAGAMRLQETVDGLDDTLVDIRSAVRKLDEVLEELKAYPSGFIFGKPPLPANSVAPPAR